MRTKLLAIVAVGVAIALVAAAPSSGQVVTEVQVVEVAGGGFGIRAEVRSDLLAPPPSPVVRDLIEAAVAEDARAAASALERAGVPSAVAGAGGEAVLAAVGPVPEVDLPPGGGGPFTASLADVALGGLPIAGFVEVSTQGALGADGFAHSGGILADLDLIGLLGAEAVITTCESDRSTTTGATELIDAGGDLSGPFDQFPGPNSLAPGALDVAIPIGPDLLTIQYLTVLNEQVVDEVQLRVNGMHTQLSIRLDPEGPGVGDPEVIVLGLDMIVSQSRCGTVVQQVALDPGDPEPPVGPVPGQPTFAG